MQEGILQQGEKARSQWWENNSFHCLPWTMCSYESARGAGSLVGLRSKLQSLEVANRELEGVRHSRKPELCEVV